MDNALAPVSCERPNRSAGLTAARLKAILWECAWQAVIGAFIVEMLGGIAIGMVSGLLGEMMPSAPPGFAGKALPEAATSTAWNLRVSVTENRFAIIFALLLVGKAGARLVGYSRNRRQRNAAAWLYRSARLARQHWFKLIVANAFTAFVGTIIWQWAQQFSLTQLVFDFGMDLVRPAIHAAANFVPGSALMGSFVSWFSENQFKFVFWLLYIAALCDDLGLPNYKALARLLWRRVKRRLALGAEAEESSIS
jgi:hypothetical protein